MTPPSATAHAYRENTILAASPEQLVVMLYDGAQRFLRRAQAAMQAHDPERAHNEIRRAELIVAHLDGVLDDEHDPKLAARLHTIYGFCLAHAQRARIEQDPSKLEEVARLLAELRESWAQIASGETDG
ncbi:MAG TPA: flagellar export chaperone FliS [Solirubrobacteraceae bacterium]|jgi:flagellar protein FliS